MIIFSVVIVYNLPVCSIRQYVLFTRCQAQQFDVTEVRCSKAVDCMQSLHSDTCLVEEVAIFSIIYFDFGTVFLTSEMIKISNYPNYSLFLSNIIISRSLLQINC